MAMAMAREGGDGARGAGGVVLAELGGAVAEAGAVVSRLSSGDAAGPGGADPVLWLASAVYALGLATLRGFEQVLGAGVAGAAGTPDAAGAAGVPGAVGAPAVGTVRGVRARVTADDPTVGRACGLWNAAGAWCAVAAWRRWT